VTLTQVSGYEPVPPMVSPLTRGWGAFPEENLYTGLPASGTYDSGALAVYFPIWVPSVCVARRVWWANGATTSGGATVEVGIYADAGEYKPAAKLISGSATQGTASQAQFVDITDTTLTPNLYWLALQASTNTNTTLLRVSLPSSAFDAWVRMEQSSANPLPATATPVESATASRVYLFGFSTTTIT